uniref:Putative peptidase n=1 Tax=viral metagenome TaxID=1070528 RepID=A0A6H1ZBG9_9ZZZZ
MPRFSQKSLEILSTCDPLLREIALEAIEIVDFSVLWGYRLKDRQDELFAEGFSDKKWPFSKHNHWPSRAIDVAPWPIDWEDEKRFFDLAIVILFLALKKNIPLRWGGAWKGVPNKKGQLNDLGHFELLLD